LKRAFESPPPQVHHFTPAMSRTPFDDPFLFQWPPLWLLVQVLSPFKPRFRPPLKLCSPRNGNSSHSYGLRFPLRGRRLDPSLRPPFPPSDPDARKSRNLIEESTPFFLPNPLVFSPFPSGVREAFLKVCGWPPATSGDVGPSLVAEQIPASQALAFFIICPPLPPLNEG